MMTSNLVHRLTMESHNIWMTSHLSKWCVVSHMATWPF